MSSFRSMEDFSGLQPDKLRAIKDIDALKLAVLEWSRGEARKLNQQKLNMERTGAGSINISVSSGGSSSSSAGSSETVSYRAGTMTISASGTVNVPFSEPFDTDAYQVICLVKDSSGIWTQIFDDSITKTANQFSFTSNDTGSLVYFAFLDV